MTAPIIHSIDDLKEWDRNPREITHQAQDGLATSLQEFGDLSGIVFNATLGALVSGHQRVETIRKKWGDQARVEGDRIILPTGESIGIRVVEWDRAKQTAANIAANSPTIAGTFTEELRSLIDDMERQSPILMCDLNLDLLKIEFGEFWKEQKMEEDEVPPAPKNPRTKRGDIYELSVGGGWFTACSAGIRRNGKMWRC